MSADWAKFCPNLNTPQYRETLSDEKKTELDERATKLAKRASCNKVYALSEFCWEVSAWNDVFGLLYNDERFLMCVTDVGDLRSNPPCTDLKHVAGISGRTSF